MGRTWWNGAKGFYPLSLFSFSLRHLAFHSQLFRVLFYTPRNFSYSIAGQLLLVVHPLLQHYDLPSCFQCMRSLYMFRRLRSTLSSVLNVLHTYIYIFEIIYLCIYLYSPSQSHIHTSLRILASLIHCPVTLYNQDCSTCTYTYDGRWGEKIQNQLISIYLSRY